MPFNVQDFIAHLDNGALAHSGHYDVVIQGPATIQLPQIEAGLMFRADSVTFPGRQIITTDYTTLGPLQKIAYDSGYPPVDMSIIESADFAEKQYFQRWQNLAIGFASATDQALPGLFHIGYYNDYVGTVAITQYDATGAMVYACKLVEAYPTTVQSHVGRWEDVEIVRCAIQFSYRYFVDDPAFLSQAAAFATTPNQNPESTP